MNKEKETGPRQERQQPVQEKKNLDICTIMIQLGIHPEKWNQHLREQKNI
ncbi:hypothetical protein [Paenibacillus lemnae]|uniref:Uncharacterized protein n=1 Tax=Paenibacillus lemnae TaxID=1330551 RepID=A0A848M4I8_PAELE|nr:hypothetical protein [Paenibacillus lemnae]NMO95695.1 hypothetical protein [Paenibacillus lemnae]